MANEMNRRGTPLRIGLLVAVVVGVVFIGFGLAKLAPDAAMNSPSPSSPSGTPAVSDIQLIALELLDCDGAANPFGDLVENHMRPGGGPTSQAVFDYWIAGQGTLGNSWGVPVSGYEAPVLQGDRYLFIYRVAGEVKVVVVISPRVADVARGVDGSVAPQPYALDEVRMCDGAEYGPGAEFGLGERAWANGEGMILLDSPGPDHCGWAAARAMNIPETLPFWGSVHSGSDYWADPTNVLPSGEFAEPYNGDAELPPDATDSGYRHGDLELWFVPDGRAVYIAWPDHVELWPSGVIGCS
jgi:hypothetical protein